MMRRGHAWLAIVGALAMSTATAAVAQDRPDMNLDREILPLRDDVYRVRAGSDYSIFLVTPDGIALADPLSRATAMWLRDALSTRFPNQDVKYLVHTHHEAARAAGSSVFNDTAEVIAHAGFDAVLRKARHEAPASYRFAFTTTRLFGARYQFRLGGSTVEVVHVPLDSAPELSVISFAKQRIVFAPTAPALTTVPFAFGKFTPREVFGWIDALGALDFETLVLGNGETMTRAAFDDLDQYLSSARETAAAAYERGETLQALQASTALERFSSSPHYAARAAQLTDVFRTVRVRSGTVSAGGLANYSRLDGAFCANWTDCAGGGAVPAARVALSLVSGVGPGLTVEGTLSFQSWSARTSPALDEELASRRARTSMLFRYNPSAPRPLSFALLGGVSVTRLNAAGAERVKGVLPPRGGAHLIARSSIVPGVTAGVDIVQWLGNGYGIAVPIRVTRMFEKEPLTSDSRFDVQAGIDLTFRLFHRVHYR